MEPVNGAALRKDSIERGGKCVDDSRGQLMRLPPRRRQQLNYQRGFPAGGSLRRWLFPPLADRQRSAAIVHPPIFSRASISVSLVPSSRRLPSADHKANMGIFKLLLWLTAVAGSVSAAWLPPCPQECWCHLAAIETVEDALTNPLPKEFNVKDAAGSPSASTKNTDRWRSISSSTKQLKTVICAQQNGTDINTLLALLPPQTEALRIIQAPDVAAIHLRPDNFRNLDNLKALNLEGSSPSSGNWTLILYPDALKSLSNLQYLSLKNVELSAWQASTVQTTSNVDTRLETDDDPIDVQRHDSHLVNLTLTFIEPEEEVVEILPYDVYKLQRDDHVDPEFWDAFSRLSTLEYLHILSCKLPHSMINGEVGIFSGLTHLKELVIESSRLRLMPKLMKGDLKYLRVISLTDNLILDVNGDDIKDLTALQLLDLSRNNLTHLTENSFPHLAELKVIDLRENPIESLYPYAFSHLNGTRILRLGYWNSSTAPTNSVRLYPDSFHGLSDVHELWVGPVVLQSKTDGLSQEYVRHLRSLAELHVSGRLSSIDPDTFTSNGRLQVLDLKQCRIQHLSIDAFQGLRKLKVLDLSANRLRELPYGLFDPLSSLKELWLNDNQLTTLVADAFATIGHAKLIRLENNPWHCTCDLDQLKATSVNKVRLNVDGNRTTYAYDKLAAPLCSTPAIYRDQSIFDVMRRDLRCKKRAKVKKLIAANGPMMAALTSYSYQQLIEEHGPEVDPNEPLDESNTRDQVPDSEDQEYIDHGPEIIEEPKVVKPVLTMESLVLETATTTNPTTTLAAVQHVNDVVEKEKRPDEERITNYKSLILSPTLSKKSLKLLMEEERLKKKQSLLLKSNKTF